MKRQIVFSETAFEEAAQIRLRLRALSPQTAVQWSEALRSTQADVLDFPFSHSVSIVSGDLEIRRVRIGRSAYFLFYFVYPSVDFNTGEGLDIIHFLACRHQRQGEPNWEARDPFRL